MTKKEMFYDIKKTLSVLAVAGVNLKIRLENLNTAVPLLRELLGDLEKAQYRTHREMLIPQAEARADEEAGEPPQGKAMNRLKYMHGSKWNLVFHEEMERLCKEEGLL